MAFTKWWWLVFADGWGPIAIASLMVLSASHWLPPCFLASCLQRRRGCSFANPEMRAGGQIRWSVLRGWQFRRERASVWLVRCSMASFVVSCVGVHLMERTPGRAGENSSRRIPKLLGTLSFQTPDPNTNDLQAAEPIVLPRSLYGMCGGVFEGVLPDVDVQGTAPLSEFDFLQLHTGPEKVREFS